jgi:hypothetical protein
MAVIQSGRICLPQSNIRRIEIAMLRVQRRHPQRPKGCCSVKELTMILLGVVLLIIGFVFTVPIIWTLGIILVVVGAVFALLGMGGREIAGRRHWY